MGINKNFFPSSQTMLQIGYIIRSRHAKKIMQYLDTVTESNVTSTWVALDLDQSVVSYHLKRLKKIGIVLARRDGKMIFYKLNYTVIDKYTDRLQQLIELTNTDAKPPKVRTLHK